MKKDSAKESFFVCGRTGNRVAVVHAPSARGLAERLADLFREVLLRKPVAERARTLGAAKSVDRFAAR